MTEKTLNIAKSINSYLKIPEESDFLVREAEKAKRGIIEVGSWTGRSSLLLESVAREKMIPFVAVDTWQSCDLEPGKDFFPTWKGNMAGAGFLEKDFKLEPDSTAPAASWEPRKNAPRVGDFVQVIRADSILAARLFDFFLEERHFDYDFLFIDADHEYESVKQDFFAWVPHLAPGSTVVFHDVNCGHEGVRKFFLELGKAGLKTWEEGNIGAVRLSE